MSFAKVYKMGLEAFQAGKYDFALEILSEVSHPDAAHLAALSAQKLGNTSRAKILFERASKQAPADYNIANNFGHFLLANGDLSGASICFETALKLAPNLPAAFIGLAKIETTLQNWESANRIYTRILEASPNSRIGKYGLGTTMLELGDAEGAKTIFSEMLRTQEAPEIIFMLGRANLELDNIDAALSCFQRSYEIAPTDHTLRNLANLLWMKGEIEQFIQLTKMAPATLSRTAIELTLECGETERALDAWKMRFASDSIDKTRWLLRASIARAEQNAVDLSDAVDRALAQDHNDVRALDLRIVADLMLGAPEIALKRLAPLRAQDPNSQHWIAHEFVAHRMLGQQSPLLDVEKFVRAYDIEPPPGYDTIERFNADLTVALKQLHKFQSRPLNQSLQGPGTQTTRSLTDHKHPVIAAYIKALETPIRQYLSDIGQDSDHPTSARNTGAYKISGMWSVWLRGQGYHESHVHPRGWVSSAYYVSVPEETKTSSERPGWIGFGAPPYKTVGASEKLKWLQPQPGRVVLFPSFIWHGTNPVGSDAERLTAPFDLVPA